jgi:polysaccharide biosynthesis/export protein
LPDIPQTQDAMPPTPGRAGSSMSLRAVAQVVIARRRFVVGLVAGLLLLCLLYCLIAPNQYEARARVAIRVAPITNLSLGSAEAAQSNSALLGMAELETLAGVFRSDQLAWRVIQKQKLYAEPAFNGWFERRFPHFNPAKPDPEAEGYLLERFQRRLHVSTVPRTLLVEIRFRTRNAALSAEVVNSLIHALEEQEAETRTAATRQATGWLDGQLAELKTRADEQDRKLAEFERQHGILIEPETNGQEKAGEHLAALTEVDDLSKELVTATSERILREAEFRAAALSDPEMVLASDPHLQNENGNLSAAIFRQIRTRRSDLEQEQAQLSLEHGPNYDRVGEIRQQLADLDKQLQTEDTRLRDSLKSAWQAALDREQMLRRDLEARTGAGIAATAAATQDEAMRREAQATRELYISTQQKAREAGLAAGAHEPEIWIVDPARSPAKPAAPNLPLYLAITLFVALWLALGGAFLMESWKSSVAVLLLVGAACLAAHAQAPTPTTSGLPAGVAKLPQSTDTRVTPNPKDAPAVWGNAGANAAGVPMPAGGAPAPAQLGPGDVLDVSEFHSPEFRSAVRVSEAGTVILPMIGEIKVSGLDEAGASRAIGAALLDKGILLHPQVHVFVTQFAGQDVSVLGEVARPGVYPYTEHHRLLDLIAAASGLSATAGSVVTIFRRDAPNAPQMVALHSQAGAQNAEQDPELAPGDTVQVSRARLIYVVGDVIRPGGFTVEPEQDLTALQALSLAWGPSQNAAAQKALLIHEEQGGGRTVTTLNLKRMLRGLDPDPPVHERDILYVPDSAAKNLWNRSMESVVQSVAGVGIYAGLVYSQRF